MPSGTGGTPAGGSTTYSKTLLTIIGAACTSETFRYLLFHDKDQIFKMYPDLKLSDEERKVFEILTAKRDAPNPIELAIAHVHDTFVAFQLPCAWPSCRQMWKLAPSPEQMDKRG